MYYVIIAKVYKDYGENTCVLGITTEEDKVQQIIEEAENSEVFDMIGIPNIIEVENINCFSPSVNPDEWDYSDS